MNALSAQISTQNLPLLHHSEAADRRTLRFLLFGTTDSKSSIGQYFRLADTDTA